MNSHLLFWAKLGSAVWPEMYHPVLCHLIDVAAVASTLWTRVFRPRFRASIAGRLGLEDAASGRWLAFCAGAHDIGKVSPCFQDRGPEQTGQLRQRLGDDWFKGCIGYELHGALGTKVLADELTRLWPVIEPVVARNIAVAVGGHHGIFPTNWIGICEPLGNERWTSARRDILKELARVLGVIDLVPPGPVGNGDHSVWMCLAGLTSVADWIGSDQEFFEPVGNAAFLDTAFNVQAYYRRSEHTAARALRELGWLGRAESNAPVTFSHLFPFIKQPRPLQESIVDLASVMAEPELLIVEAPMGEGKTEAAWYTAAAWDRRGGQGTYVALPTMATSNQMFERVGKYLEADAGGNLMLLHGKAALNERFAKLRYAAQVYDDEKNPSAVVAEAWFAANKKHGLLAPFGVGTIDQVLLAVLQTKHVFVRLFGLAGKCVILDEVHAYDAYMTTLMERLLRWLAALGCPVVLLSATLPKEKRLKLLRAYAGDSVTLLDDVPYPRITCVSADGSATVRHVEADKDRARKVQLGWLKEVELVARLREALAGGGCAVVIRNTVGLAQQTFLQLRDALLGKDGFVVELFHARFPFGRRQQIEDGVLRRFGKEGGPGDRNKRILVATQVVEQSLDLDFDLMISDLAPVDLILQRAGRLHRHERDDRSAPVSVPRMCLIQPDAPDGVPDFGISGIVYSPHVLFRSLLALRSNGTRARDIFRLPAEIDSLVAEVYQDLPAPDSLPLAERDFWASTRAKHLDTITRERSEAETRQIKKPQFRGALARMIQEPRDEDNPDLHPAHQALTRLTRPTVSLICLEKDDNGTYRLPHDSSPVPTLTVRKMSQGGFEDIGRLILGELTSAHWGLINQLQQAPLTPQQWTDVGMLCRHHLILFSGGKALVGEYELSLDNSLGLTVARANGQGEDE